MDHIVYLDAAAAELVNLVSEKKTMIIRGATGRKMPNGRVNFGDKLYPGGNVVELIARHSLPSTSAAPFSGRSVLSISEIGIAAEDVEAQVDAISARSGASVYHGPGTPTFTAVGDEYGLFIVVQRGRIWFPETGVAAEPVPIIVLTGKQADPLLWQFA